jgi:hypothetical protein
MPGRENGPNKAVRGGRGSIGARLASSVLLLSLSDNKDSALRVGTQRESKIKHQEA